MKTFITLLSSLLLIVQMPAYANESDKAIAEYNKSLNDNNVDKIITNIKTLLDTYSTIDNSEVKSEIVSTLSVKEDEMKLPIIFWAYLTADIELLNSTIKAFGDEPEILEKFLTAKIIDEITGMSLTPPLVVETLKSGAGIENDNIMFMLVGNKYILHTHYGIIEIEQNTDKGSVEGSVHKDMILITIEALGNNSEALREWLFLKNERSMSTFNMIINSENPQEIASMINIISDVLSKMPQKLYYLLLDELSDRALVEEILMNSNIANTLNISFDDMHASYVHSLMEDYTITLRESITSPDIRIITEKLIKEYQNTQDNDVKNKIKELLQMTNEDNKSVLHSVAYQFNYKDKPNFLISVIAILGDNLDMLKLQDNNQNYTFLHWLYDGNADDENIEAIKAIIDRFNNDIQRDFLAELLSLKNSYDRTVVDDVIRYEQDGFSNSGIVDKVKDVFKDDDALKKIITIE